MIAYGAFVTSKITIQQHPVLVKHQVLSSFHSSRITADHRRNLSSPLKAAPTDLFALDLDGVIADSQNEVCSAGYETAVRRWPSIFAGITPEEEQRVRNGLKICRSRLVAGYEMALMARMILEDNNNIHAILTVDNWEYANGLVEQTLGRYNETKTELAEAFEAYRNHIIETDTPAWVAMSPVYDGVSDALTDCQYPVYFVSSKKEERVVKLLNGGLGLDLDVGSPRVFASLQPPSPKKIEALRSIMSRPLVAENASTMALHFVDDRWETLKSIVAQPDLSDCWNIYLASWGYVTEDQIKEAQGTKGVRVITLPQFCELLRFAIIMEVDDGCQETEEETLAGVYKKTST